MKGKNKRMGERVRVQPRSKEVVLTNWVETRGGEQDKIHPSSKGKKI